MQKLFQNTRVLVDLIQSNASRKIPAILCMICKAGYAAYCQWNRTESFLSIPVNQEGHVLGVRVINLRGKGYCQSLEEMIRDSNCQKAELFWSSSDLDPWNILRAFKTIPESCPFQESELWILLEHSIKYLGLDYLKDTGNLLERSWPNLTHLKVFSGACKAFPPGLQRLDLILESPDSEIPELPEGLRVLILDENHYDHDEMFEMHRVTLLGGRIPATLKRIHWTSCFTCILKGVPRAKVNSGPQIMQNVMFQEDQELFLPPRTTFFVESGLHKDCNARWTQLPLVQMTEMKVLDFKKLLERGFNSDLAPNLEYLEAGYSKNLLRTSCSGFKNLKYLESYCWTGPGSSLPRTLEGFWFRDETNSNYKSFPGKTVRDLPENLKFASFASQARTIILPKGVQLLCLDLILNRKNLSKAHIKGSEALKVLFLDCTLVSFKAKVTSSRPVPKLDMSIKTGGLHKCLQENLSGTHRTHMLRSVTGLPRINPFHLEAPSSLSMAKTYLEQVPVTDKRDASSYGPTLGL